MRRLAAGRFGSDGIEIELATVLSVTDHTCEQSALFNDGGNLSVR